MPIPHDYLDILTTLADQTDKGLVNWKYEGNNVDVLLDNERIVMWAGTDERSDEGFVSFALKDSAGETLDLWYLDAGDEHYDFLNLLFLGAKRHALGIPDRLARIREHLVKIAITGNEGA